MIVTVNIPHERDLGCGSVAFETVTAVADVDLSNEANPVSWVSVEGERGPITGWELTDMTSPLSALEDAVLTEAVLRRSAMAKTAGDAAARSVA